MEEQEKSLSDYIEALKRRRKLLTAVVLSLLLIALGVTFGLPAIYRSKAVILIEQQEIPKELVTSTVTSYADQRIQEITQRVMTTSNLLDIIKRFELYQSERKKDPLEVVVEDMRKDISVDTISADVVDPIRGQPTKATIAFTVSYENRSADLAQKVANELVSLYLKENLTRRTEVAEQASSFLAEEGDKLKARIAELEHKLAEFKEKNAGKLPDMKEVNLQMMDRTDQQLIELDRQIRSLEDRRVYLQGQLALVKPTTATVSETGERILGPADRLKILQTQYVSLLAKYSPNHPDVIRTKKEMDALQAEAGGPGNAATMIEKELEGARAELASLQQRYSANHPDVVRATRTVANLEKEAAEARARRPNRDTSEPDNPAYIQLRTDLQSVDAEISAAQQQKETLRGKVADYEEKLSASPQVEREFRDLTRDYETSSLKYQEITQKLMAAQVSQTLETEQKGERFSLIEPPLVPEKPAKPNRLAIALLGSMLAFAGGIGSTAVAEALDPSIYGRTALTNLTGVPPLAVIPEIVTPSERRKRVAGRIAIVLALLAAVLAALAAIHFFYQPLDVLWFRAMRKFGFIE
ncbi:MAG: Wzz/FepE/Etk N-terminal domain-containing protein [Gammaproteobacteria bacterium]